jgi:hypothetical protein
MDISTEVSTGRIWSSLMAVPDSKDRTVVVEYMMHPPGDPFSLLPVVKAFEDNFPPLSSANMRSISSGSSV